MFASAAFGDLERYLNELNSNNENPQNTNDIVYINQDGDGSKIHGMKRKLSDDDEIVNLPTPRQRHPMLGRT